MKRNLTPSHQQHSSHTNTMALRLSNAQLQRIRKVKDSCKYLQKDNLERLKKEREEYEKRICCIKFYYDEFKPNMKKYKEFACLTDEDLEEQCKKIEFTFQDTLKDKKKIVEYFENLVRYFVSMRQQNLKNVLKYHKLCKEFEDLKMEQVCNGQIEKIDIEGSDEVITGEGEIARVGSKILADKYLDRKDCIALLIRCKYYFK